MSNVLEDPKQRRGVAGRAAEIDAADVSEVLDAEFRPDEASDHDGYRLIQKAVARRAIRARNYEGPK